MCGAWKEWWTVSVPVAAVPVRQDRARLQAYARVAAEMEGLLDHDGRVAEGRVDVADVEDALEGEVVAEFGVDRRRRGIERRLHVDHGGQRVELDLDRRQRVLGLGAAAGDDRAERLADPGHPVDGERVLRAPSAGP